MTSEASISLLVCDNDALSSPSMIPSGLSNSLTSPARRKYSRFDPIVYTTLFHWFTPDAGNVSGPWLPVEGRSAWTGKREWWVTQIRQIMMANIDMIHVHLISRFEEQREEFFAAFHELRRQGYDVPKLVPFLDPFGIWPPNKVDVASQAGKDEVVSHYIRFFEQYFAEGGDANAADYLGQIDGRIVLSSWWVYNIFENLSSLTREDIENRLRKPFAGKAAAFNAGIYMVSTALIDPDLTFSDERAVFFSGFAYCVQSMHEGVRTYHVQAGYWDQNLRAIGFRLPRDGGKPYREAWDFVLTQDPHRIYIESWNEYDEGSGIYAADTRRIYSPRGEDLTKSDKWSDSDDPFEYIRTTANGAARFNKLPTYDARVLAHTFPEVMKPGERRSVNIIVRNDGNTPWRSADGICFALQNASAVPESWQQIAMLQDHENEASLYGGVFRGRPVRFSMELQAPLTPGEYLLVWSVKQLGRDAFGQPLQVNIQVSEVSDQMVESNKLVSAQLDDRFLSERGLYGRLEDLPLAWQMGHHRRVELLAGLDIGDVRDKVCVDFGTGSWGFAGIYPRLHSCKYAYGMDISPAALAEARKLAADHPFPYGNRIEYLQSDGLDLPLPDASADLIFAGEAIEHIRFPKRFLRECHRVLREGGQLVLTTPNRDALLYRTQGDQYCVGPEHFWLFNFPELEEFVSEYFDVKDTLGFNGSIYRSLDNARDETACREWAAHFLRAPQNATGLIFRAVRKPGPTQKSYALRSIDRNGVTVIGPSQTLPLEFGMKGTMISEPGCTIFFVAPPCEGLILHFWTHAWSGYVRVKCGDQVQEHNLFTKDAGWKPVLLDLKDARDHAVEISPAGKKDERSASNQVIYFEAVYFSD